MARADADLDEALDELYAVAPADFTAARDGLARKLKAAGDPHAAAEVKRRRKPTQLAYVLNQLSRSHAEELAELVDVGRALARAQRRALRGEAGHDLREAIGRQRAVVASLTKKTATLMTELGVDPTGHLDEVASALQAALVDPAVGEQLEQGRLEKVPAAAAGFPGAEAQVLLPSARTEVAPDHATSPRSDAHAAAEVRRPARAKKKKKKKKSDAASPGRERAEVARARAEEERRDRARAKADEEARAARAEAADRASVAEKAERDADGYAAEARQLTERAAALAGEAKRLSDEAKRLSDEAKRAAREAALAERAAADARTRSERASSVANRRRTEATRAARRAGTRGAAKL